VHPRVNADEQAHLQVHAKHQRNLFPARVEIQSVTSIGATFVRDLETVPVDPSSSAVRVGSEGVADQLTLDASWRLDREFEWGCCGISARENLGAAFSECVLDAVDDVAST